MKKKYYLLFILCLMLIPFNEVKGADKCGMRYYKKLGQYVLWYDQGGDGYCGPAQKYFALGKGYSEYTPYKYFVKAECTASECTYYYSDEKDGKSCTFLEQGKAVSTFPNNQLEMAKGLYYCAIRLYYDSPPSKDKFETVSEGQCLKEKQTGKYVRSDGGKYDLNTKYGYEKANESKCLTCRASYLEPGCQGPDVSNLQAKLIEVQQCEIGGTEITSGYYGQTTEKCVEAFNKARSIKPATTPVLGTAVKDTIDQLTNESKNYSDSVAGNNNTNVIAPIVSAGTSTDEKKSLAESNQTHYYTITYNTDGGHFINGESERKVFVSELEVITSPVQPGKEGYKFLGWYTGNNKYEFGKKLSSNLTLTAKWEKVETTLYCLNDNDVLDVDKGECITAEEFDTNDSNITEDKFFVPSGGTTLQTIETRSKFKAYCNDAYVVALGETIGHEGSNNTVSCSEGYVKEYWRSADIPSKWNSDDYSNQCLVGSYCGNGTYTTTCSRIWRGTCYQTYTALDTTLISSDDSEDNDNTTGGKPSQEDVDKNKDNDVDKSPDTGNALILVAWTIGLGALGYSIYWFQKRREEL